MRALAILAVLWSPASFADERRPFCELTPCVPGTVTTTKLLRDEPHGSIVCAKGSDLGRDTQTSVLVHCTTAKAAIVDGIPVAARSYTLFHPNGRIYQSHASKPFDRALPDGSTIRCGADLFALEPSGTLRYCKLAAPRAGSPRPRVDEGISFHPSGRVATMTLDEDYTAAGNVFVPGTHLVWDARGQIVGGWAKDPIQVGGLAIDWDFELYPSGKLKSAQLAKPAKLAGHDFPEGAHVGFRADGTLEAASYVAKRGFMIHGEPWTDTRFLTFDATGKIKSDRTEHWQAKSPPRPPKSGRGGDLD